VGYVPNNNIYCIAQTLAVYLSLYISIEGKGAICPFPGTAASWKAKFNYSSQDVVARFSIFASLHPNITGGRAFNVADAPSPTSWSALWPAICEWFGLQGGRPDPHGTLQPSAYIRQHAARWTELVKRHGLKSDVLDVETSKGKSDYQYHLMTQFDFDRTLDLSSMHDVGFQDFVQGPASWWTTFERIRQGKQIP